MNKFRRTSSN